MPSALEQENQRLEKLRSLKILDSAQESDFDRITSLAVRRFNMPITLVSLVDKDRQWFKSRRGVEASQTPIEASFCREAINRGETCVVQDSLTDDAFRKIATHPTYATPIRFYAGVPLTTKEGHHIGSFCIADYNPKYTFSEEDKKDLEVMADMVITLIEKRAETATD